MTTETLKLLEKLIDSWANSPYLDAATQKDMLVTVMDHLPDLLQAVKECEAAQKACAEMRDLLRRMPPISDRMHEEWWHALSTDCGKGYHHEVNVLPLVELLRRVLDWCHLEIPEYEIDADKITQALAQWEKLKEGK